MIADFIALLFFSRDYAHRAHLRTTSYAVHMALEKFYEDLLEAVDELTETYQGRFDILEIGYYTAEADADATDPVAVLQRHYQLVKRLRYEAVPKAETMLHNQIDTIESIYARALYKLKHLS